MTLKDIIIAGKLTISEGGGGGDFYSGTFTPTENTLIASFDVGGDFDYFIIFAEAETSGYGVRALRSAILDFSIAANCLLGASTNNSGTGIQSIGYYTASEYFSREGNVVKYSGGSNNLIANVQYRWIAFKKG